MRSSSFSARLLPGILTGLLYGVAGQAHCSETDPAAAAPATTTAPGPAPATATAPATAATSPRPATAPPGVLADERGGADTISNQAQLSAVVSNNSATQVTTGANIIQSNSFANATGIPVVIQNSGANVLIQNATVINLQLK